MEEKFFLPSVILESKNFNRILADTYSNPFDDKEHIVICSYQFAKKQIRHIERVNWDLVVLDEAHKLRNVYKSSNKTAIVLKEGLKNYKKLLLTATPLQNNVQELYGLISIIDDGYFGGLKSLMLDMVRPNFARNQHIKICVSAFSLLSIAHCEATSRNT